MTEATLSTASDRRSYRCYHCNNAFHITTTVGGVSSSFRCPCCYHRHLLPNYTIVSVSPLPQPQPSTPDFTLSTTNSLTFDFSDSETENDDSDSDDLSLEFFFSPQFRAQTLKSFIDSLPSVKIDESLKNISKNCSICLEEFEIDKVASELPCKHFFHNNCIVPWLNRSSTCPLCRHELPQEDVGELEKEHQVFMESVYDRLALVPMPSSLGLSGVGEDVHDPRARERDLDEIRDEDGDVMMADA